QAAVASSAGSLASLYTHAVRAPEARGGQSLGSHLRRLRLRAGLSQEALAERAGVGVATVASLEEGRRRRPYPSTMAALADALDAQSADRTLLLELAHPSTDVADPLPQPSPS